MSELMRGSSRDKIFRKLGSLFLLRTKTSLILEIDMFSSAFNTPFDTSFDPFGGSMLNDPFFAEPGYFFCDRVSQAQDLKQSIPDSVEWEWVDSVD